MPCNLACRDVIDCCLLWEKQTEQSNDCSKIRQKENAGNWNLPLGFGSYCLKPSRFTGNAQQVLYAREKRTSLCQEPLLGKEKSDIPTLANTITVTNSFFVGERESLYLWRRLSLYAVYSI